MIQAGHRFHITRSLFSDDIKVYLNFFDKGELNEVKSISWVKSNPNSLRKPDFDIPHENAQQMFDALWKLGFRSPEPNPESQYAAINCHLQDMRALAFGKIGVEKPQ
jgi:hypothetical protein